MKKTFLLVVVLLAPALAIGQENDWNMGVEKRLTALENGHADLKDRVTDLEEIVETWNQGGTRQFEVPKLPKEQADDIFKSPDSSGEGAPVLDNDSIIALYLKHEADISKIWKSLGNKEDSTMRKAVERYLAMKSGKICDCILSGKCTCKGDCTCPGCPVHRCVPPGVLDDIYKDEPVEFYGVSWKGAKPTNKGREGLFFGASWCVNCPSAVSSLGSLTKDVYYIDCSTKGSEGDTLAAMHRVSSYPTLIVIEDGIKVDGHHAEGSGINYGFLAAKWLGKEPATAAKSTADHTHTSAVLDLRQHLLAEHGFTSEQLAKMSDAQVEAAHNSSHGTVIAKSVPSRSSPMPSYNKNVVRYGGTTWTWPGNLRRHLETVHGVSTAGLSDSQLRTVHDNLHNTGRSGITSGSYQSYATNRSYSSGYRASAPRQTFQTFATTRSYGSCPNCAR